MGGNQDVLKVGGEWHRFGMVCDPGNWKRDTSLYEKDVDIDFSIRTDNS